MRSFLLFLACIALANGAADYQRYSDHLPASVDPHHSHCKDVAVDTSDTSGKQWLSANAWQFTTWKKGLCNQDAFPSIEQSYHPSDIEEVTLRKLGRNATVTPFEGDFAQLLNPNKAVDCRLDKTSDALSIAFTNGAKSYVKIRGCMDPKGIVCKPYKDCDLTFAPGATETIVLDKTFKYFVFTYRGETADTELYPDADLKWRKMCTIKDPPNKPYCHNEGELDQLVAPLESAGGDIVLHSVSPGNQAHCTELFFVGGKNNEYYKAHGYQYSPPIWQPTPCPAKYNWFNSNKTIAKGVTEELRGVHTR